MGCTSSSPNMVNPKSNTAEKSIQFEGETSDEGSKDVEEIIYRAEDNDKSEINVLPSCDTLTERIQVVRNKSNPSLHSEKDTDNSSFINGNTTDTSLITHDDEKIPKLEEVVNKVVELYIVDHVEDTDNIALHHEDDKNKQHIENQITDDKVKDVAEDVELHSDEEKKLVKEHLEEALSPSQSESSRATRWEALADIAAELPPSLAVDPITGQIYSLLR